jgi:hypothetical protein
MPNWLPEDQDKKAAARQGLLALGGALMGGRGNLGEILGGGLMAGTQGYQGAMQQRQQDQLRQAQMKQIGLENQKLQAAADEPMQLQKILSGGQSAPMGPPPGLPRIGGAPSASGTTGAAPAPTIAPAAPADQYATLMGYAERLTQAGRVAQAKPYYDMAEKLRPKLKAQEARMVDGQRVMANVYEDGRTERVDGFAPDAERLHFANTGGATVALDQFTGKPANTIQNTQSPDSRASVAVQMRGQNMTDARARDTNATKAPQGYRWAADGKSLESIPGGPASKSATSTEGERKAATLLMRMEGSERQLQDALKADPSADKPGLISSGLRAMGGETLANSSTGEARQRVEAAQLDILDSALTLGTGAAYTREQLESYRKSYFPQLGDKPKNIAEKQERLRNVIAAAKIAAGRAGPAAEAAIETPVKAVKDLPKKAATPQAFSDTEKERRYQEWKRSQNK